MKIAELISNTPGYFQSSPYCDSLSLFLNSRFDIDIHTLEKLGREYNTLTKNKELARELQKGLTSFGNIKTSEINEYEATHIAEKWHKKLFENDHIRILHSHIQPSETVPLHNHPFPGIIVILTEFNRFLCINSHEKIVEETWETGIYQYDGSLELNSYKNIDNQIFKALIFELKK